MPRPAATVVVLRPDPDGFRVFMVQRHRKSGFLPHAWVFPGGRVDPGDDLDDHPAVTGGDRAVERMGLERGEALAFLVAAARETFEESGIWLGTGSLPADQRDPLARGEVALSDLLDAHGATVDLDRMVPWGWWITPKSEPRRYDTRFFVALADTTAGRHDERETVNSGWFTPAELVSGAEQGVFPMAPPTWWTLRELAEHPSADAVFEAGWVRPQRPIEPILNFGPEGFELLLPGHPDHPEASIAGLPTRVAFRQGRWWAEGLPATD